MKNYNPEQIKEKLENLDGWALADGAIEKPFKFKNFKEALVFINQVGILAEESDHHPEINNVYNRVTLRLNTHSTHGITDKDFELAEKINEHL